jgi:hypothetical protein
MSKQSEIQAIKDANPTLNRFEAGIEIELTGAEYDAQIEEIWRLTKKSEALAELEAERAAAKAAAQAKLAALGLTVEDLTALGL